ncbi:PREDICTED: uncharacterized protein LOC105361086 [Ceratosolen solmsi marchali]|uniref:Uncharacterized protein LOC105361086 n=1 Tax=Ceratosolen solmsi marchali TaxID=326594 RepID=A0AAJ6YEC4_9HYME|nr:PREDICTED: uncharacterized protein LOC105361086 [Ceratosolen solmsi marchali]
MRLILQRHHNHDCHDHKSHRNENKSRRILKKIAKLEKKLERYNINDTSPGNDLSASSRSSSRSRSPSKSRNERTKPRRGKRERRFEFFDESSDSDRDSNLSASAHSKLISEYKSNRRRASCSLPRSRSLAAYDNCRRGSLARGHHRQRLGHRHSQHCKYLRHHYQNGIAGCLFRNFAQSEPNLQIAANELDGDEANVNEGKAESGHYNDSDQESEINRILSDDSLKIIQYGLPAEKKRALLKKYRANKNCLLLTGPKLNDEILPTATKMGIKSDVLEMYEQNQIGAGLVALGQAISDLTNKSSEFEKDHDISNILQTLNDAAAVILDTQYNITKKRQLLMLPELHKKVRSVVRNCRADEWLYGNDFGQKIKNAKILRKEQKSCKKGILINPCDETKTCKYHNYDDEELEKHLD